MVFQTGKLGPASSKKDEAAWLRNKMPAQSIQGWTLGETISCNAGTQLLGVMSYGTHFPMKCWQTTTRSDVIWHSFPQWGMAGSHSNWGDSECAMRFCDVISGWWHHSIARCHFFLQFCSYYSTEWDQGPNLQERKMPPPAGKEMNVMEHLHP